jgi:hypothetical protein
LAILTASNAALSNPSLEEVFPPQTGDVAEPADEQASSTGAVSRFLETVNAWLAEHYDLPAASALPRVEFASPLQLVSMRYKGVLPYAWREDSILNPSTPAALQREVVAIYNDTTRTIFLPIGWTGKTPAERSVLVHEMVHHLPNIGKLSYECPAAREKLAYEAQGDWLKLHGLNLEKEFDVDLLTLLVTSACMN